jgi:hypothetical protein
VSVAAEIRIDDLREPRRGPEEQALFEASLAMRVELDARALVDQARQATGLYDFGDPSLIDRLSAQVRAVQEDAGLSGLGRLLVRQRLVGLLVGRLRFNEFLRRHPEALEVELPPPVVVVGLPRSGTTHLVNLLAADSRFRSMPWWEVVEPIPVLGDGPGADGVDPRYLRCQRAWEASKAMAPLASLMHDRPPWGIEEDCELVDLDLCSYTLEWHARVPSWRDYYLSLDQEAHYRFLRRELQVLSYLRGPTRWVLKTPQHLEQLGPLMAAFPGATIALTLRDPVAVLQSAITMLAYGDRFRRVAIDADDLAGYWMDRLERLLRTAVEELHLVPGAQRIDVEFGEFMADDLAMATRILETAGLGNTEYSRAQLSGYLAGNPRHKEGRVLYDLRGDFGLDPAQVRERFSFYFEAFPQVRPEVF